MYSEISCQDVSPACILFTYSSQCFYWVGSIDIQNQAHYDDVSAIKLHIIIVFKCVCSLGCPSKLSLLHCLLLFLDILSSEINNKHGCNFHFLRRQLHITAQEKTTGLLIWSAIHHFLPVKQLPSILWSALAYKLLNYKWPYLEIVLLHCLLPKLFKKQNVHIHVSYMRV